MSVTKRTLTDSRGVWIAGALSAVIMSGHLLLPLNADNSTYQSMALAWVRYGRLPYIGSWDQNFPGIIAIHSIGILLFGNSDFGFQMITLLLNILSAVLLYSLARRWFSEDASLMAAIVYAFVYVHGALLLSGQRDVFAATFLLLSIYLLTTYRRNSIRLWPTFFSGFCAGFVVLIRPTYVVVFLVLALVVFRTSRCWKLVLPFVLGGSLVLLVFLLPYVGHPNSLVEVYHSVVSFNLDVYGQYPAGIDEWIRAFESQAVLLLLAGFGAVIVISKSTRSYNLLATLRKNEKMEYVAILAALFLSPFLMRKYADYRYFPLCALIIPLAGFALVEIRDIACHLFVEKSWSRWLIRTLFFAGVVLFTIKVMVRDPIVPFVQSLGSPNPHDSAMWTYIGWKRSAIIPSYDARIEMDVASYLSKRIGTEESVEICTLWPGLTWRLGRRTSTRFTTLYPLCMRKRDGQFTQYQLEWRREFVDSLRSAPPSYIILTKADTSDLSFVKRSPDELVRSIPGVDSILNASYKAYTVIGPFSLFRRKG